MALNEQVVKELPRLTRPVLFMQGRKDTTVAPNSMNLLCSLAASKDKQTFWLEDSGHVLPLEPDAHIVNYLTEQFIKRLAGASHQQPATSN
jgi:esterase/lipase